MSDMMYNKSLEKIPRKIGGDNIYIYIEREKKRAGDSQ